MGPFIPLIIFGVLTVIGMMMLIVWRIKWGQAEARRWIDDRDLYQYKDK